MNEGMMIRRVAWCSNSFDMKNLSHSDDGNHCLSSSMLSKDRKVLSPLQMIISDDDDDDNRNVKYNEKKKVP